AATPTTVGYPGDTFIATGGGTYFFHGATNDDLYIFDAHGGDVTIADFGGHDTLELGAGLVPASVTLTESGGSDLLITDGISGDLIDVAGLYSTSGRNLALIYGDGTSVALPAGSTLTGSAGSSVLGTALADTLIGGTGTETLSGNGGDDI